MSTGLRNCYGKGLGKLAKCRSCELRRKCVQAGDPPPIGMIQDLPNADKRGMDQARTDGYMFHEQHSENAIPDPGPTPGACVIAAAALAELTVQRLRSLARAELGRSAWIASASKERLVSALSGEPEADGRLEAATLFARACGLMLEACAWESQRLAVGMGRSAGLSYAEIGARLGISKQAVHKHILAIAKENQVLGEYLAGCKIRCEAQQGAPADVVEIERRSAATLREHTTWMQRGN